jgi:uncharacterized membrane protein (UPF0127 family)
MIQNIRTLRRLFRTLFQRRSSNVDRRFKLVNLTRNTVLATSLEFAASSGQRRKGLLGRNALAAGEGLWIAPCEAVHTFWMRFPIDLVFLDRNNRIRKLISGVPPWRLSGCLSARSVVELSSGAIQATQTQPGDLLEFSIVPAP